MFNCQISEGVHPYLLKCCRGKCSFVGMLKGYMVRKRLGTPDLEINKPNYVVGHGAVAQLGFTTIRL